MASLVALLKELPAPIAAGWVVFVAWVVVQMVWYRRAHVGALDASPAVRPAAPSVPQKRRMAFTKARPPEPAGPPLDTIDIPDDIGAPSSGVRGSVLGLG
jgi:hypothetical protein